MKETSPVERSMPSRSFPIELLWERGYLTTAAGGIERDFRGEATATEPYVNAGSLGNTGVSTSLEHSYCDQQNFQGIFGQNSRIRLKDINTMERRT